MRRPKIHRSTLVVALGMLVPTILVNVSGEIVSPLAGNFGGGYTAEYVHGWPQVYMYRSVDYDFSKPGPDFPDIPKWNVPWLAWDSWRFWRADKRVLWGGCLICDFLVGAVLLLGITGAWEWRRRHRARICQFSIGDLLTAFTLVAVLLGWWGFVSQEYDRESLHVNVLDEPNGAYLLDKRCRGPRWLSLLVGESNLPERFQRVSFAILANENAKKLDGWLPHLKSLKHLQGLEVRDWAGPPPVKYSHLKSLPALRYLYIQCANREL